MIPADSDWRSQLQPDFRQRIINKIMETLKKHVPFAGEEGMHELNNTAVNLEEEVYSAATSQSNYLRKISIKMLIMESKYQPPLGNSAQPDPDTSNQNLADLVNSPQSNPGPSNQNLADLAVPEIIPEIVDWRSQLEPGSRQRIVDKMMPILKMNFSFSGQHGLLELTKIAERFEERTFSVATSQLDYFRKISLKMLSMERKSQPLQGPHTNTGISNQNPADSDPYKVFMNQMEMEMEDGLYGRGNATQTNTGTSNQTPDDSYHDRLHQKYMKIEYGRYGTGNAPQTHTDTSNENPADSDHYRFRQKCMKIEHGRYGKGNAQQTNTGTSNENPADSGNFPIAIYDEFGAVPELIPKNGCWRSQLLPDSRQRILNKILETLKRHLPHSGQDGLLELTKIAKRFEEKTFTAATSQSDYLRKISLKMLTMETKSHPPLGYPQPESGTSNQNPAYSG